MGVLHIVYVGPYAVYQVPSGFRLPADVTEALQSVKSSLGSHGYPPKVEVGGVTCERQLWTPFFSDGPGAAEAILGRPIEWRLHGTHGDCDLTGVDHAAEARWFRTTFAKQLALLRAAYGREPEFRWGVVSAAG